MAAHDPRASIDTSKPPSLSLYPVLAVSVHDGDTFRVSVPMHALIPGAMPNGWQEDVRLAHVNAAELSTGDGKAAAAAVQGWLLGAGQVGTPLRLGVWGRDKYGRLLADVQRPDGELLSTFVLNLAGTVPLMLGRQLAESDGTAR